MNGCIIYSSKYDHAKNYAMILHNETNYPVYSVKDVKKVKDADIIILVSSIYASTIKGYDKIMKYRKADSTCYIVAVGISDASNQYSKQLRVQNDIIASDHFFYVKGGFDYDKLSFFDKKTVDMIIKHPSERDKINQMYGDKGIKRYYKNPKNFVKKENIKTILKALQE